MEQCEFKKGDVVVRMDGGDLYSIVRSDPLDKSYGVEFNYAAGEVGRAVRTKEYVDRHYVKVD